VEVVPEPVSESVESSEPVVEVSEPVVEPVDAAEPVVEIVSEPIGEPVGASPEPVDEPAASQPRVEAPEPPAASDWSFPLTEEAPAAPEPELREQPTSEDEVKVRSVETISAIDLLMGEVEEDEAAGSAPGA
jgi:hypothetical protein